MEWQGMKRYDWTRIFHLAPRVTEDNKDGYSEMQGLYSYHTPHSSSSQIVQITDCEFDDNPRSLLLFNQGYAIRTNEYAPSSPTV